MLHAFANLCKMCSDLSRALSASTNGTRFTAPMTHCTFPWRGASRTGLIAFLLGLTLVAAPGQEARPDGNDVAAKADAYLAAQAHINHFSGSALISQGDKILFAKGVGLANIEHGVPNAAET